ncbi:MAG: lactate utilization protein [Desulfurococcales archaeon]|nr:lactate utilization protein [Desulfurococcales archaeon]
MAKEVKEAKEKVIGSIDQYINQAIESLKAVNAKPYLASTPEEAREYVASIVGSGKTIVFSKSMVAEEIGLREYLEEKGNEVWETDLGQLLIQLEHGKPMHTTAPAIHLTRERVAMLLKEKLGADLSEDDPPEKMVKYVRKFLRGKFTKADIGISGANAIAADTGIIFLVENEGNIKLVTGLPGKHIVITGIEKILPTTLDAFKTVLVQAAYAGLYPPTYINIIAGPSSTADIEHTRVYGAHGPLELHVILLDNGRRKAVEHPFLKDQLRCIRCGRCQYECPVWRHTANLWGGPAYGGPMGVNWTAITLSEEVASGLAMLCLNCRRCEEVCPVEIPIAEIISKLKTVYTSKSR